MGKSDAHDWYKWDFFFTCNGNVYNEYHSNNNETCLNMIKRVRICWLNQTQIFLIQSKNKFTHDPTRFLWVTLTQPVTQTIFLKKLFG